MISAPQAIQGRIEFRARPAGVAFYVTPTGERWQIYDCVQRSGWLERVYLESDAATHRVFVQARGRRMVHRRRRHEPFVLSPATCALQLATARRLPSTLRFDPAERIVRLAAPQHMHRRARN
jgi:hypothetical protein